MSSDSVADLKSDALNFHREPRPGKLEISATKPLANQRDLALAYSPGVAFACEAIVADPHEAVRGTDILASCTDSMQPVYDAEWIEKGMHGTNLGRREMPDKAMERFDVVVRQGTAGLQMKQTERFQAERGLSPAAFVGGTVDEMKRIPEKNPQPGFGGDSPEFTDRGQGGDKPDFADLVTGKCKGRSSRDQVTFYRNVGNQGLQFSSVGGWVYAQALKMGKGREIPTDWFLQDIRD